jgi:hypothetical protein
MACEDEATATPTLMVMGSLQSKGGFTAIHSSAVVDQFSHGGYFAIFFV